MDLGCGLLSDQQTPANSVISPRAQLWVLPPEPSTIHAGHTSPPHGYASTTLHCSSNEHDHQTTREPENQKICTRRFWPGCYTARMLLASLIKQACPGIPRAIGGAAQGLRAAYGGCRSSQTPTVLIQLFPARRDFCHSGSPRVPRQRAKKKPIFVVLILLLLRGRKLGSSGPAGNPSIPPPPAVPTTLDVDRTLSCRQARAR